MVKLQEVEDEHFADQINAEDDDDYYTDTDSEISTDEDASLSESLAERLVALKDIIPPSHRAFMANTISTTAGYVRTGLLFGGKSLWVVSTSVLLLGVPWALAFAEDQQYAEMEREANMQKSAAETLGGTVGQAGQQMMEGGQGAKPAL
ncbi:MAG: mitochondrial import receptor protein [Trizodia sp. TS-e1964]|nr:MAG: mitochondrial import receptor protein [Trizodia sp. TS-e1964]